MQMIPISLPWRPDALGIIQSALTLAKTEFDKGKPISTNYGIDGSTFRAYRGFGSSPSDLYQKWVKEDGFRQLKGQQISSREALLLLRDKLDASLIEHWGRSANDLKLFQRNKLIDLFLKAITFSTGHECIEQRLGLFQFANVPLDKWSLLAVKKLFYGIVISRNPSMGDIEDKETYDFLQDQIFQLTLRANVPNLVFDYYAWNSFHRTR